MGPHSQSWKLRHVVSNPLYIGGRLKLFGFKLMSLFSSGTCFRALTALCLRCGAKFTWMLKEKESYRLGFTGRLWVVLQDCAKGILSIGTSCVARTCNMDLYNLGMNVFGRFISETPRKDG